MVFAKYERAKYIFIFFSLFIYLYFSCTTHVILIEIIWFLWNRLIHPIFRVPNLFRSFLLSIIFGDLSVKNKSVTWHISFFRMWSFLGWNLTVIFVSYVGICGTLPDEKPRGHVITVVQIGKLILIVCVREFLANGTFTRQAIDVWE